MGLRHFLLGETLLDAAQEESQVRHCSIPNLPALNPQEIKPPTQGSVQQEVHMLTSVCTEPPNRREWKRPPEPCPTSTPPETFPSSSCTRKDPNEFTSLRRRQLPQRPGLCEGARPSSQYSSSSRSWSSLGSSLCPALLTRLLSPLLLPPPSRYPSAMLYDL